MAVNEKKVLIVEDQIDTADMFAEMLKLSGFKVLKSHGGKQAIDLIQSERPDAVVLDIMMPGVSGLDVLEFVRGRQEFKELPVVVVSAKSLPADIQAGFAAGATEYLTKPVSYQDLQKTVEESIRKREGGE